MEIKNIKIEELKPTEYNPRGMTEKEKKDLIESIKRFGMVKPIVVNEAENRKNIIIGGHQRFYVCRELGWKEMPAVYVNIPEIEREKELNLRLNRNLGHWDWDLLTKFDGSLLLDIGFEEIELDRYGFDLKIFESEEFDFNYPFGTINSWVRIGDFCCEIEDKKYQKIKKRGKEQKGIRTQAPDIILKVIPESNIKMLNKGNQKRWHTLKKNGTR